MGITISGSLRQASQTVLNKTLEIIIEDKFLCRIYSANYGQVSDCIIKCIFLTISVCSDRFQLCSKVDSWKFRTTRYANLFNICAYLHSANRRKSAIHRKNVTREKHAIFESARFDRSKFTPVILLLRKSVLFDGHSCC